MPPRSKAAGRPVARRHASRHANDIITSGSLPAIVFVKAMAPATALSVQDHCGNTDEFFSSRVEDCRTSTGSGKQTLGKVLNVSPFRALKRQGPLHAKAPPAMAFDPIKPITVSGHSKPPRIAQRAAIKVLFAGPADQPPGATTN